MFEEMRTAEEGRGGGGQLKPTVFQANPISLNVEKRLGRSEGVFGISPENQNEKEMEGYGAKLSVKRVGKQPRGREGLESTGEGRSSPNPQ